MSNALVAELERDIEECSRWARRNYNFAQLTFGATVLGSFVSAILVGLDTQDWSAIGLDAKGGRILLTALTALPAALLLLNNTMRFEDRAKWFWRKTRKAQTLMRELRDGQAPVADVSQRYSAIAEEMETEWPAFGSSPSQPKKDGIA